MSALQLRMRPQQQQDFRPMATPPAVKLQEPPLPVPSYNDDLALEEKIEQVQKSYFLAMAQIAGGAEDVKAPSTAAEISKHLTRLASQFRHFARLQPTFESLSAGDKAALLRENTDIFVQYILARFIKAKSSEEQLRWLLDVNMPENLSNDCDNNKVSLSLVNDEAYESMADVIASSGLVYHGTALVANLLLFRTSTGMQINNMTGVNANFIEALEMLRESHAGFGQNIKVEPILYMVKTLEKMNLIFSQRVQESQSNEDRSRISVNYDVNWFKQGWAELGMSKELVGEFSAYNLGVAITPYLMPTLVSLIQDRLKSAFSRLIGFSRLAMDSKAALWARNSLGLTALCLAKIESTDEGRDQMRLLEGDTWRRRFATTPGLSNDNLRKCPLTEMLKATRTLCEAEIFEACRLASLLKQGVSDDDAFMLMAAVVLFSGPEIELTASVAVAADFYRKALISRLRVLGLTDFDVDAALRQVDKLAAVVPKVQRL